MCRWLNLNYNKKQWTFLFLKFCDALFNISYYRQIRSFKEEGLSFSFFFFLINHAVTLWQHFWSQMPHLVKSIKLNILSDFDKSLSSKIHLLCLLQLPFSGNIFWLSQIFMHFFCYWNNPKSELCHNKQIML